MAYERELKNTEKWRRIISCNDEKEQGTLIKEYICELEAEIYNLKQQLECEHRSGQYDLVNKIMKLPAFNDWLSKHDSDLNKDWSGLQGGL